MKMLLGLSEALPTLVESKFRAARASEALIFSSTELAIVRTTAGVPFQLRYCPALEYKPRPEPLKDDTPKKKFDPFENPVPELFITDVPTKNPNHYLVLNKFPVIPNHFILATKLNKQQSHILEEADVVMTHACLRAWEEGQENRRNSLFAFFNSGEHSGASQPHRHLQFLPVADLQPDEASSPWRLLVDSILSSADGTGSANESGDILQYPKLPIVNFARRFSGEPSSTQLYQTYKDLYEHAKGAIDDFIGNYPGELALHPSETGNLPISYNLAMTTSGMAILPRRAEYAKLRREEADLGEMELNGTTLGGTLMVKKHEQWEMLKQSPEMVDAILESVGIPTSSPTTKL